MKKVKVLITGLLVVLVAGMVTVNFNLTYHPEEVDMFTLHNVEALAQGEGATEACYGSGSVTCDGTSVWRAKYVLR